MKALSAVWHEGQVVLDGRADWPEGCRLVVRERPAHEFEFMSEEEQSDDPRAIQQWIDELRATPVIAEDPSDESARLRWEEQMRRFNIEAVGKQFEASEP